MIPQAPRTAEFECLIKEAKACLECIRMNGSQRVIGHGSGRIDAPIMFIGEAPGRLGADTSAIPFHGDKAGDNFENLIEQVGISRYDCFITNATLCNPKDDKGNNATPNRMEIASCARFLKRQIDLVDPRIVVTLGAQALWAINLIEPHELELANSVRKKWNWYGRILVPLYHPGQRAMLHRSFLNQLSDYHFVAETHRRLTARRKSRVRPTAVVVTQIARQLLLACGPLSYFSLHKLFYLLEYEHYRAMRQRMTHCYIIRQKDGPYVVELNIRKLKKALPELKISREGNKIMLSLSDELSLFPRNFTRVDAGNSPDFDWLRRVSARYANRSDEDLKRIVYLTSPMRQILRREKYGRQNLFNVPIDFSVIRNKRTDTEPSRFVSGTNSS
jgi:uracil-DNA glycosylase family 4